MKQLSLFELGCSSRKIRTIRMMAIIGAALAPAIALLSFFYLRDKYEAEPLHMVIKTFIFGVLLVFPVMVIQYGLSEEFNFSPLGEIFFLSGFLEEFFKWFVLFYTIYKHVEFDQPYDGIVYATAVSLGFATLENFFYLYTYGLKEAFMRALLPVSSHALFGVMMGYYLGKSKFDPILLYQRFYFVYSLFLPAFLHGLYDWIILASDQYFLWFIIPFMLIFWVVSMNKIAKALAKSKMSSLGRK
jgi:RsiW-degrading membrane proteinase PrsW (M82 family)